MRVRMRVLAAELTLPASRPGTLTSRTLARRNSRTAVRQMCENLAYRARTLFSIQVYDHVNDAEAFGWGDGCRHPVWLQVGNVRCGCGGRGRSFGRGQRGCG